MRSSSTKLIVPGGVDEYIAKCPLEVQDRLKQIRSAIQEVAPGAIETVSYFHIPGYAYEGYDYNGMFAWFSYQHPYIRLHIRPPVIQDHKTILTGFITTKGIVSFPADREVPIDTVRKLVKASLKIMKGDD